MAPLFFIVIALFFGIATRHFFRKSPIPYTVLLVIIGFIIGGIDKLGFFNKLEILEESVRWAGNINPHFILFVFLPTLIFEAAFALDYHTFKKTAANAIILAVLGILIAFLLTALGILAVTKMNIGLESWSLGIALLFGAVISATDPVAVVALLKELGVSKKITTLIEGESMLNDGTGIVLFLVILASITGIAAASPLISFLQVAFGGILIGLVIAAFTIAWVKRVFNDAMVEITLMIIAAYMTFFIAEEFLHVSGVLGLVALGLSMTAVGKTRITPDVQHFLHEFWSFAAFLANTLIFIIVGVVISEKIVFKADDILILFLIYIIINIARALMIFIFFPLMRKSGYGLTKKEAIILWWGALRGAVGLALALILANEKSIDESIRNQFLFYVAGIVMLTLLINATTVKWLIFKLKLGEIPFLKALLLSNIYNNINEKCRKELELLKSDRYLGAADWNMVKEYLPNYVLEVKKESSDIDAEPIREFRRRILEHEKISYWSQFKEGLLSPVAVRKLTDELNYLIDCYGTRPLDERDYLKNLIKTSKLLNLLMGVPLIKPLCRNWLFNEMIVRYDILKGFISAQDELKKLVAVIDYDINQDKIIGEDEKNIMNTLTEEINKSRLFALKLLMELQQAYPGIEKAVETRQAARALLNFEKSVIARLKKEGRIEDDEVMKLEEDVEIRIKKLVFNSMSVKMPEPFEILKEVSWLRNLDETVIRKVLSLAEFEDYKTNEPIITQGKNDGKGMLMILNGSVRIVINNKIIDILGAGSIIGEMSVLAGVPRTASVFAETPASVLWLATDKMNALFSEYKLIEENLWKTAASRFAENLLSHVEPYRNWPQIKIKRWIQSGELKHFIADTMIDLTEYVGVIIYGNAISNDKMLVFNSPDVINSNAAEIKANSRVFLIPKPLHAEN